MSTRSWPSRFYLVANRCYCIVCNVNVIRIVTNGVAVMIIPCRNRNTGSSFVLGNFSNVSSLRIYLETSIIYAKKNILHLLQHNLIIIIYPNSAVIVFDRCYSFPIGILSTFSYDCQLQKYPTHPPTNPPTSHKSYKSFFPLAFFG